MATTDLLQCGRFRLALDRPRIMGVLNVTPDSFSDGGRFLDPAKAIAQARRLVEDGADLIDVGAESTRPGAGAISADEEWARLAPVLQVLLNLGVPISVDTRQPAIMQAAIDLGVDMINDIAGFRAPGAIEAVAGRAVAVCVMHMQGEPSTMQLAPAYRDPVSEIADFLYLQAESLQRAGVAPNAIVVDPGIGFGKTQEQNIGLVRGLPRLVSRGLPVLIGVSRKSLIGHLTGRDAGDRLAGSLGGALAVARNGAKILRVHDVRETRDALLAYNALVF